MDIAKAHSIAIWGAFIPCIYFIALIADNGTYPTTDGALAGFGALSRLFYGICMGPVIILCVVLVCLFYSTLCTPFVGRVFSWISWGICVFFYTYRCTEFQFLTPSQRTMLYEHPFFGNVLVLAIASYMFFNATLHTGKNIEIQFVGAFVSHFAGFYLVLCFLT